MCETLFHCRPSQGHPIVHLKVLYSAIKSRLRRFEGFEMAVVGAERRMNECRNGSTKFNLSLPSVRRHNHVPLCAHVGTGQAFLMCAHPSEQSTRVGFLCSRVALLTSGHSQMTHIDQVASLKVACYDLSSSVATFPPLHG